MKHHIEQAGDPLFMHSIKNIEIIDDNETVLILETFLINYYHNNISYLIFCIHFLSSKICLI